MAYEIMRCKIVPFDWKAHLNFVQYTCPCGCRGTLEGSLIKECPECGAPMIFQGQMGLMYRYEGMNLNRQGGI